jgi:hypothetical protein
VDSGNLSSVPQIPGAIFVFGARSIPDDGRAGYWTSSFDQENLIEAGDILEARYDCDWHGLYQAWWIDPADYGADLRQAVPLEDGPCAEGAGGSP